MNKIFSTLTVLFLTLGLSTTASAHAGLSQYSVLHSTMHILASVSVYLALMSVGFFVYKRFSQSTKK